MASALPNLFFASIFGYTVYFDVGLSQKYGFYPCKGLLLRICFINMYSLDGGLYSSKFIWLTMINLVCLNISFLVIYYQWILVPSTILQHSCSICCNFGFTKLFFCDEIPTHVCNQCALSSFFGISIHYFML